MPNKGRFGETLAESFLYFKGYELIEKNWTCHWGEIDLVVISKETLVFVEVKLRTSKRYGVGFESISYHKKRAQLRAIENYLANTNIKYKKWRFDVVTVLVQRLQLELQHFQAVPLGYHRDSFLQLL